MDRKNEAPAIAALILGVLVISPAFSKVLSNETAPNPQEQEEENDVPAYDNELLMQFEHIRYQIRCHDETAKTGGEWKRFCIDLSEGIICPIDEGQAATLTCEVEDLDPREPERRFFCGDPKAPRFYFEQKDKQRIRGNRLSTTVIRLDGKDRRFCLITPRTAIKNP